MYNSFQRNLFVVCTLFVMCALLLMNHTGALATTSSAQPTRGVVTVLLQTDHQYGFGNKNKLFSSYTPVGYGIVTSTSDRYSIAQVHIQCLDGADQCAQQKYSIKLGVHSESFTDKTHQSFKIDGKRCAPLPMTISGNSISCSFAILTKISVAQVGQKTTTVFAIIAGEKKTGTLQGSTVHFHQQIIGENSRATLSTIGLPVYNAQGAAIGLLSDDATVCGFDHRCQKLPITFVSARDTPRLERTLQRPAATLNHSIQIIKTTDPSLIKRRISQLREKCKSNKNYMQHYILASSSCALMKKNKSIALLRPDNDEDVRYAASIVRFMELLLPSR
jgi:hypothetical protein